MTALSRLQSPLHSTDDESEEAISSPITAAVVALVAPLKDAQTSEAWRAVYARSLPQWRKLRLAVSRDALLRAELELDAPRARAQLDKLQGQAAQAPLTPLREPAGGAAQYARDLLFWVSESAHQAARQGVPLDGGQFSLIEEDIAGIELCWLTLLRGEPPRPAVAEEAAWVAYARARHLRHLLPQLGFSLHSLPQENPHQAHLRAAAMIDRMADSP